MQQVNWREINGIKGLSVTEWRKQGVENFFTARQGGCSEDGFYSLNLGLHVADVPDRVLENRKRLAEALNISCMQMVCCEQIHGTQVQRVGSSDRGRGVREYATAIPATDALITNEPEVYLVLFFADCIPLFFFDPATKAVGLAHGGWKGAWGKIAAETVQAMQREFQARPDTIQCWIGVGIGSCCFEIGEELVQKVQQREPWSKFLSYKEAKWTWDLKQTHRIILEESGILPEHIFLSEECSSCQSESFFSYRRDGGRTGRMAAVIGIK